MDIPRRDKTILRCLHAKLSAVAADRRHSERRRRIWEEEQDYMKRLKEREDKEYSLYLLAKREDEANFRALNKLHDQELETRERLLVLDRMYAKELDLRRRLDAAKLQKDSDIEIKKQISKYKSDSALDLIKEQAIENVFWRKKLNYEKSLKNISAAQNRNLFLRFIKQKTSIDNQIHEENHLRNFHKVQILEREYEAISKSQLVKKLEKIEKLKERREQMKKESRDTAMFTAKLRENLKKCFLLTNRSQ